MRGARARAVLGGMALTSFVASGCAYDGNPASRPAQPVTIPPSAVVRTPVAEPAPKPAWRTALDEGIDAYDKGNFREAARRLRDAAEHPDTPAVSRVEAHKYHAFALCSSNLRALCRQQFERALALDPAFDLLPAERGHPIWGPEFQRAKGARAGRAPAAADQA